VRRVNPRGKVGGPGVGHSCARFPFNNLFINDKKINIALQWATH
jgi:hypothetical protein